MPKWICERWEIFQKSGNLDTIEWLVKHNVRILILPIYLWAISYSGLQSKEGVFKSTYDNLGGNILNIVMPNKSLIFSQVYTYPDKSQVRTGADYLAALYFGEALNFKPKYTVTDS